MSHSKKVTLTLELRPGVSEDFKTVRNGKPFYLYGRFWFAKVSPGKYTPEIFSSNPSRVEYFNTMWREGLVYVIDNSGMCGVIDGEEKVAADAKKQLTLEV